MASSETKELNTVRECLWREAAAHAFDRCSSGINHCSQRSQILFPVSSLKDEENGITKSATGNNKSKYISLKWEEVNWNGRREEGEKGFFPAA